MQKLALKNLLELSDAGVWGEEDSADGISVLRSTNFRSDGRLDFNNLSYRSVPEPKRTQKELSPGDILLEKSGGGPKQPVGRVCLFRGHDQPHAFGNFLARLRPKKEIVEPEYLFYRLWYFHAEGLTASYQKQTSGIRNLETKRYLDLPLEVPTLSEQRRIVDLLSRAENIVRLRKEAEAKAKAIIPALFVDMFGDPATNPRGGKQAESASDEGHRGPPTVVRLGEVVSRFEGGKNLQAGAEGGSPYRILKISAITSGRYDETQAKFAPEGFDPPQHYVVKPGDLLFSRANTEELVGATALVDETDGKSLLPDKLWRFVWKEPERISPTYMLALFQSRGTRRELSKIASGTGGAMKNISQAKLAMLPVSVPPLPKQLEFERFAKSAKTIEKGEAKAVSIAQASFQSLLAGVFGE